jgi:hypothetical protein
MTLQQIEEIVLFNIGYDRYSSLSIDTDPSKIEDFAALHKCVWLAREDIKRNTYMPQLFTFGAVIPSVANQSNYSLPADYDLPVKMFYMDTIGSVKELIPLSALSVSAAQVILGINTGTPSNYIIAGTVANLIQVYLLPTPIIAGESLLPIYKPVLANLTTSTSEDVIMKKYPETVMFLATAYAFQIIKKDSSQHDKYMALGRNDYKMISLRETSANPNAGIDTEALLTIKRTDRLTI